MNENYPLALPEGTVLAGQYVIEKILGQGGFGITYQANDHKNGRKVAIKEFFPDSLATRQATTVMSFSGERGESFEYGKECFLQEAETLAKFIGNENIVRIYSYFEENGTAYFVMEYIEGTSFDLYLKQKGGKISFQEAAKILVPIMDALEVVHSNGLVHRDVTPDNIYITNNGVVKLLDFGAARYSLGDKSRSLDIVLKHGFAPKEQYARHGKQGPYTDVYALGATFYFALTGKRPPDSVERMDEDELIPPSNLGVKLSREEEAAILLALNVRVEDRFQSMRAFKNAMLSLTSQQGIPQEVSNNTSGEISNAAKGSEASVGTLAVATAKAAMSTTVNSAKAAAEATANVTKKVSGAAYDGLDKLGGAILGAASGVQTKMKESSEIAAQKKVERDALNAQKKAEQERQKKDNLACSEKSETLGSTKTISENAGMETGDSVKIRKNAEKKKVLIPIIAAVVGIIAILAFIVAKPYVLYSNADKKLQNREYDAAITAFTALGDFQDSINKVRAAKYGKANDQLANGAYDEAIALFEELGVYQDSSSKRTEAEYLKAKTLMENGQYAEAGEILSLPELADYEDTQEMLLEIDFQKAIQLVDLGGYDNLYTAIGILERLYFEDEYQKDETIRHLYRAYYEKGKLYLEDSAYEDAIYWLEDYVYEDSESLLLEAKNGYVHESAHWNNDDETTFQYVKDLINGDYPGAQNTYDQLYSWKLEILGFNNSETSTIYVKELSVTDGWYCHLKLTGGEPGASTKITYGAKGRDTGLDFYRSEPISDLYKDGNVSYVFLHYRDYTGSPDQITFVFYGEDGEELASSSLNVVKE